MTHRRRYLVKNSSSVDILPDLYVSVNSKYYHPLPLATPEKIFKIYQIPATQVNFFEVSNPQASLGPFILINFILFHPFQDLNFNLLNEHLQIWRKNTYLSMKNMQNCKSLNLIYISCF